ncbi:speckle-type POZ protein B-like isoform X1 [Planococcus citri]|uniref:speckle-type POZ protein B-like isoform X1 n=1 Tax=Planococcus citri TaxID=170843 RepID=UPI0031F856B9
MSSSLCGSFCKSNGCKTKIHYHEASYVWTIEDFHFHEVKGEPLLSPVFSSVTNDQVKWCLKLDPNAGETREENQFTRLILYLNEHSSIERNKKIFAEIAIGILNSEGTEIFYKNLSVEKFIHSETHNRFPMRINKKDTRFQLVWNNAVSIRIEVKFSDMDDIAEDYHQCDNNIQVPEYNLPENLASLCENQEFTDVILSVNGKDFSAHKVVLAACSPVFHAMFKHNTKENQLNRIDIEDINEVVVGEMLKYIYTGKCANLETLAVELLAVELLAVADKYDLYQLKMMCAKTLLEGLSVENAASVLALADMHAVKELKNKVIKFIVSKPTEVMSTEGWKSIRSNFELVDEVLCLASGRPVPGPSTLVRSQSWWAAANLGQLVPILLFFSFFFIFQAK